MKVSRFEVKEFQLVVEMVRLDDHKENSCHNLILDVSTLLGFIEHLKDIELG